MSKFLPVNKFKHQSLVFSSSPTFLLLSSSASTSSLMSSSSSSLKLPLLSSLTIVVVVFGIIVIIVISVIIIIIMTVIITIIVIIIMLRYRPSPESYMWLLRYRYSLLHRQTRPFNMCLLKIPEFFFLFEIILVTLIMGLKLSLIFVSWVQYFSWFRLQHVLGLYHTSSFHSSIFKTKIGLLN